MDSKVKTKDRPRNLPFQPTEILGVVVHLREKEGQEPLDILRTPKHRFRKQKPEGMSRLPCLRDFAAAVVGVTGLTFSFSDFALNRVFRSVYFKKLSTRIIRSRQLTPCCFSCLLLAAHCIQFLVPNDLFHLSFP